MKTLLIVGANSFLANDFMKRAGSDCRFVTLGRNPGMDLQADLTHPDEIDSLTLPENIISLDGILFFQGLHPERSAKDADWDRMQSMHALNLSAPVYLLKCFHETLNPGSAIIFFSSIATRKGSYDPSYAAAKSGIQGLIQSLANEFGTFRFNAISLGLVEGSPVERGMSDHFRERHKSRMFGQALIQPEEVSKTLLWILDNPNVNRIEIALDGGYKQ